MSGVNAGPDYLITAARAGTIRFIVDGNAEPTGDNNYVWIEHADGEWSKYTHFQTGSVTGRGHQAGDFVNAGTILGREGDVGQAGGDHLHFEIAVPDSITSPIDSGGFIRGLNRVPRICGIPGNAYFRGQTYTAAAC
jgi:murein DD-endopeptidase MepM/ murein hydrolase activator NlpD